MKSTYTFPAIFSYDDDGISISFPDLPGCLSCAETTEEALRDAEEVLGLFLYNMEKDGETIPEATPLEKIKLESSEEKIVLVKVWMPLVRSEMETASVKKTLTIPAWLNEIAEANGVNFSQVLQAALKEYLGVKEKTS